MVQMYAGGDGQFAQKVLQKQLKDLMQNEDIGCSIGLENENDLFLWNVIFEGPSDTLYEGGFFKAQLKFPQDYPQNPPEMKFISKMWHPNIYDDGRVCISILHAPGFDAMNAQESADEKWRPVLGIEAVILSVISMLNDPNIDSPANMDAMIQFRDNLNDYKKRVRRLAQDSVDYL